jgi:hypothetical protein
MRSVATAPAVSIVDDHGHLVAHVGDTIDTAGGDLGDGPTEVVSICGLDPKPGS